MAVQVGIELTGSPPFALEEGVQITRRLAFQHVIDRSGQFVSQDGQGWPLAVFVLPSGEQLLCGGMIS
jgi:hypothetical protein